MLVKRARRALEGTHPIWSCHRAQRPAKEGRKTGDKSPEAGAGGAVSGRAKGPIGPIDPNRNRTFARATNFEFVATQSKDLRRAILGVSPTG